MKNSLSDYKTYFSFKNIFILCWVMVFLGPILTSLLLQKSSQMRPWQYCATLILLTFIWLHKSPLKLPQKLINASFIFTGILFCLYPLSGYYALETNGFDFSVFDWMTRSTIFNQFGFEPVHSINHYSIHSSWILLPVTAFRYLLLDHPAWLIGFGGFLLWVAVIPLWHLSMRVTNNQIFSVLVSYAYLTNSFTSSTLNSFFKIECFYPLAIFCFLLASEKNSKFFWLFSAIFLYIIKEDAALYLFGYSLFILITKPKFRFLGAIFAFCSIGIFFINTKLLQPLFAFEGQKKEFLVFWSAYGTDLKSILISMINSPLKVATDIILSGWWKLYLILGFLPLLSLKVLLFSLPGIFLLGTASNNEGMHQYGGYYPIILMTLALYGMVELYKIKEFKSAIWKKTSIFLLLIFPLHHGSSIRTSYPKIEGLQAIQNSIEKIKGLPIDKVCTQASLIPYIGYELPVEALTYGCMKHKNSVTLLSRNTKPYPYSKTNIEQFKKELPGNLIVDNKWITVHVPKIIPK